MRRILRKVRNCCDLLEQTLKRFRLDATALDVWVLDQLRSLLHNATTNDRLAATLRQDKTVFFLHLLGLDTTGHSYRPHSRVLALHPLPILVTDSLIGIHEQHSSCRLHSTPN